MKQVFFTVAANRPLTADVWEMALTGDTGGSAVIRAHRDLLALTEVGDPAELVDVDTPG